MGMNGVLFTIQQDFSMNSPHKPPVKRDRLELYAMPEGNDTTPRRFARSFLARLLLVNRILTKEQLGSDAAVEAVVKRSKEYRAATIARISLAVAGAALFATCAPLVSRALQVEHGRVPSPVTEHSDSPNPQLPPTPTGESPRP